MRRSLVAALCILLCLMCACAKNEHVRLAEEAIAAIGTVTLDSGRAIEHAEKNFNALSEEDQAAVENRQVLIDARQTYNALRISHVEGLIDDLGTVTLDSGAALEAVHAAYAALPKALQKQIGNFDLLEAADARFAFLETLHTNSVQSFKPFGASGANTFSATAEEWYSDGTERARLLVLLLLQGESEGAFSPDLCDLYQAYAAIDRIDGRVDIYCPYGDGQILGLQYWPDTGAAQAGIAKTRLPALDFLELMIEGDIIDEYAAISPTNIADILYMLP